MIRFADTFFYLAVVNPHDPAHAAAVEMAREFRGRVLTTEFILLELADAMTAPPDRRAFVQLFQSLAADPGLDVVPLSHDLWERGRLLYADRPDKYWSLTDCISFVVMRDHKIAEALTGDHHFEQASLLKFHGKSVPQLRVSFGQQDGFVVE